MWVGDECVALKKERMIFSVRQEKIKQHRKKGTAILGQTDDVYISAKVGQRPRVNEHRIDICRSNVEDETYRRENSATILLKRLRMIAQHFPQVRRAKPTTERRKGRL